jgi:hypothetical protein
MAMLCLAQAALAQGTVIWSSEDKSITARTGEYLYNFVSTSGSGTASISNLDNPIDENGYAGILGANLYLGGTWDNWAQASIGLKTENNGIDYDLKQCEGNNNNNSYGREFIYTFKNRRSSRPNHRLSTHYHLTYHSDRYNRDTSLSVSHYADIDGSYEAWINDDWETVAVGVSRDEYDEAYKYWEEDEETGERVYPLRNIQFDWGKVKEIRWTIRPYTNDDLYGTRGNLQISEFKCFGNLDLSSVFGVFGPKSMTLAAGYAATSTGAFTVLGETEVEFECEDCDGKIAWNAGTKKLDIAAGLPAGTYAVALTATNAKGTKEHEFTLTVEANTPIIAAAPKAGALKARVQNGTLHLSGLTAGKTWSVHNASGALVHSSIASGTEASLRLNASGLYFVRSEGQVGKVLSVGGR